MAQKPFQFGLRSLLWLVLLLAILLGWYADRRQRQRDFDQTQATLLKVQNRLAAEKASLRAMRDRYMTVERELQSFRRAEQASQEADREVGRVQREREARLLLEDR